MPVQDVIDLSKKYIQYTAVAFQNPKLRVHVEDGFEFMRKCARRAQAAHSAAGGDGGVTDPDVPADGYFDVVITDSSDPVGPGVSLFQQPFYELIRNTLRPPNGIMCSLGARLSCFRRAIL